MKLFAVLLLLSSVSTAYCVDCDVDDTTFMVWAGLPWIPFRSCENFLEVAHKKVDKACGTRCTAGFNIFCKGGRNMVACLSDSQCYGCVLENITNRCNVHRGNNRNGVCGIRITSQGLSQISSILDNSTNVNNAYTSSTLDPFTGNTAKEESSSYGTRDTAEFSSSINGTIAPAPAPVPAPSKAQSNSISLFRTYIFVFASMLAFIFAV